MGQQTITLTLDRETKRMVRYNNNETEGNATYYFPKVWFKDGVPEVVTLTLEW
jgi:hypothetical protein